MPFNAIFCQACGTVLRSGVCPRCEGRPRETDHGAVPDWVRARQANLLNRLPEFVAAKPTKANALSERIIHNAFADMGMVYEARELEGLDIWFVTVIDAGNGIGLDIILYEHSGEWKCSSVTKTKLSPGMT